MRTSKEKIESLKKMLDIIADSFEPADFIIFARAKDGRFIYGNNAEISPDMAEELAVDGLLHLAICGPLIGPPGTIEFESINVNAPFVQGQDG